MIDLGHEEYAQRYPQLVSRAHQDTFQETLGLAPTELVMADLVVVVAQTLIAACLLTALTAGDPPPGGPKDRNGILQNPLHQRCAAGDVIKKDQRGAGAAGVRVKGAVEILARDVERLAGSLQQGVEHGEPHAPVSLLSQRPLEAEFQDFGDEFMT